MDAAKTPRHVAIIMDGNGRWAKRRFLPRIEGHRSGAKTVRMVVEESRRLGIRYLTLFAFSSENWLRPQDEISSLMKLFIQYLESELKLMLDNDIRLRAIGSLDRLPEEVQKRLANCIESTSQNSSMDLILALSYGGRDEILSATKKIGEKIKSGNLDPSQIDSEMFKQNLYAPDVPDPELLIRTSKENRISNFLLWQLAYTEIVVSEMLWPEFSKDEFNKCLEEYSSRNRRFGLTDEQIEAGTV